tara:strand:- start:807 stop:1016 length:210 start_codon:yes stop_codon:yes gene_type:complete
MYIRINSLQEIKDVLTLRFVKLAKNNNLLPKEALLKQGIEVHSSVPNRWEAFDLESHCSIFNTEEDCNE